MSRHEIRKITVELADGELRTYRGKGVLRDVNTEVKPGKRGEQPTKSHFVTVALDIESSFAQPMPAGIATVAGRTSAFGPGQPMEVTHSGDST